MQEELMFIDADRTFRRILSALLALYLVIVLSAQLIQAPPRRPAASAPPPDEPPRVARLLAEPRKAPPAPTPPAPQIKPAPKPAAPPKVESASKAPPPPLPNEVPKERVKKVGLLGLLGGGKGVAPSPAKGFSSLKEIPKETPAAPGQKPPSFSQEEIEKIRQRALGDQEKKLTETRRAAVEADLSQAKITQEGSARSQEMIAAVVRENKEKLLTVYNRLLQKNRALQGSVTVEFVISAQGQILQCHVLTSSVANPSFEEAIIQEILRWKFPPVEKGSTTVLYPLSFSPAG